MSISLQHIALSCADLKAQEAFYVRSFGFRRVRTFDPGPKEFAMLRLGTMCIELLNASGPDGSAGGGPKTGFTHLCLAVDDLDAVAGQLRANGIEVGETIDCSHIVEGYRICFLNDPEGNRLELMQGYVDE